MNADIQEIERKIITNAKHQIVARDANVSLIGLRRAQEGLAADLIRAERKHEDDIVEAITGP